MKKFGVIKKSLRRNVKSINYKNINLCYNNKFSQDFSGIKYYELQKIQVFINICIYEDQESN